MKLQIYHGDNLSVLQSLPDGKVSLVYIDPPFNTGKKQKRTQIATKMDKDGSRVGFQGKSYTDIVLGSKEYSDVFDDYLGHLAPRLEELYRVLREDGSLFFHIDYREVHYCKVLLDQVFGRDCFMNEIIWAYDYGARNKKRWSTKHDNILWYVKNPKNYTFNYEEMDRIPYMAPGLVTKEKAARGKTPTDCWWHTIVSPNGKEKTGYPNQKPRGILDRIVKVHSNPGELLCDCYAGSGSFGESAIELGRDCILVDSNIEAIEVMQERFKRHEVKYESI